MSATTAAILQVGAASVVTGVSSAFIAAYCAGLIGHIPAVLRHPIAWAWNLLPDPQVSAYYRRARHTAGYMNRRTARHALKGN